MKRLLEEAKKMIRINSETSRGDEELANYVAGLLQERGLKCNLQQVTHSLEDVSKRQFNVIGILGDPLVDKKIRKGLLLNTHLDTTSPGIPARWTETAGDPLAGLVKDGRIYGLGASDVKLDFLCKLYAVTKFREKKLKMPIYLVGTCGEELGMFGVKYLIKSMALNPKYVLVGEPTDMKLVTGHKALNIFKVSIGYQQIERDAKGFNRRIDLFSLGRSAHGAYPHLGTNAILGAFDFLRQAGEYGFEFRFTKFEGGDMVNKVPDQAMVQFYLTSHQFEDFKRYFREVTRTPDNDQEFKVELGGVGDSGVRFLPDTVFTCLTEILDFFKGMSGDFSKVKDSLYEPDHSTVNFGKLRQNLSGITLHFDLRLLPDLMPDEIERHVQKSVAAIAARYPSLNLTVVRERTNPGLHLAEDHELVKVCQESMTAAGIEPELGRKSVSTEAAQYSLAGYPAAVFGPGTTLGNSHGPNEYNLLEQLEKAIAFYEKLIEKTCL